MVISPVAIPTLHPPSPLPPSESKGVRQLQTPCEAIGDMGTSGSTGALQPLPFAGSSKATEALSASLPMPKTEPPPKSQVTKDDSGIVLEGDDLLLDPVVDHDDPMPGPSRICTEVSLPVIGTKVLKDGVCQTDCSGGEVNNDQNPTLISMIRQLKHESTR